MVLCEGTESNSHTVCINQPECIMVGLSLVTLLQERPLALLGLGGGSGHTAVLDCEGWLKWLFVTVI